MSGTVRRHFLCCLRFSNLLSFAALNFRLPLRGGASTVGWASEEADLVRERVERRGSCRGGPMFPEIRIQCIMTLYLFGELKISCTLFVIYFQTSIASRVLLRFPSAGSSTSRHCDDLG